MKKLVIFASGSGSNAENIVKYFNENSLAEVVVIATNNPNAKVLEKAKKLEIPTFIFNKNELESNLVLEKLQIIKPDLIILAGFLWKFPEFIINCFPNKIINIHPAILPNYGGKGMYGMRVHQAVLDNKEKQTGITIHYVNKNYDEGNIIFQEKIAIEHCNTANDIALKIHDLEMSFFPKIIEKILLESPNII